jgi:ubiquinone/menaquinone biosynthesis C-methylase UbiE
MPAKAHYDSLASRYDRVMQPIERWFLTRWRAEALAHLPAEGCLLEVGCGSGSNFRFYPRGAHGVATELSGEMLKVAAGKGQLKDVCLVQNNAERMPFQEATFDAAFATLVFCSIASPREAFAELRRVVKPGGRIVLLEHVRPTGLLGPVFDFLSLLTSSLLDDHFNRRTADEAQLAGLSLQRLEKKARGVFNLIILKNE